MTFASGKHALGICDRCGLTFKLHALKDETVKGHPRGVRVCPSCWDPDHPRNWPPRVTADAEALQEPRPDTNPGR